MAVKRRLKLFSSARLDIPHLRSTESAVANDFDSALRGLVTGLNQPYLIRGFEINIPNSAIPATSLTIKVSDSAVLHATAAESGTILTVPSGTPDEILSSTSSSGKVFGAFQNGVPNYVSLAYRRRTDSATVDQVAGWSESQKIEYQRSVPIGDVLEYQFVISTSGFSTNLPLYIVGTTSSGAVEYITKATPNLFRLGRGGSVPDPYFSFGYHNQYNNTQSPSQPRREWVNESPSLNPNPVTVSPGDPVNAFQFGDFNIANMKEWMDAVMTRFKELTGSTYWYLDSSLSEYSPNLFDTWYDANGSVMTGSGNISYNLVLETDTPSYGGFQSQFTDDDIIVGDSYVEGATSGNKATLNAFNRNQLIINSMTTSGFLAGEVLYNRRQYRPDLIKYQLTTENFIPSSDRLAILKRKPQGNIGYIAITSWSYSQIGSLAAADVTINFAAPHGFDVGDYIEIKGLVCSSAEPNGVYMVKHVPTSNSLLYSVSYLPEGLTSVTGLTAAREDITTHHPFLPQFKVSSWSYVGTSITVTAPNHNFNVGDVVVFVGLQSSTNAPNGRYTISLVNGDEITYTAPSAPTGSATLAATSFVMANYCQFEMTISEAQPNIFNLINTTVTAASNTDFSYIIGDAILPDIPDGIGAIIFDGIVAETVVLDPVIVNSVQYFSALSPYLLVTTATNHGYSSVAGPTSVTIYGDQSLSPYIKTYDGVSIDYVSPTSFKIVETTVGSIVDYGANYLNSGTDKTYARFPNNPYSGPVQWSSDIIVKGVIGEKYVRIPQTAMASGTPVANKFNINGLTGTAFLQNGEVAYIIMERNKLLGNGATYSTGGGSAQVIGSTVPTYVDGSSRLRVGDFVKWEDEPETAWLKVSNTGFPSLIEGDELPPATTQFNLTTDNGQPPSSAQRPAKTGRLVYTRGTYPEVIVKKHWEVTPSADIYWLAVRRDNGSLKSKVYFRSLELEVGEVRQINDNEPSNLLVYTGAASEASVNPNYSVIDKTGAYQETQELNVGSNAEDVDPYTRQITFTEAPELNFQIGDKIIIGTKNLTIRHVISDKTVIINEDISTISPASPATYYKINYNISDSDNLTLAIRKEDRELAKINTAINRPIYDESVYPQKMKVSGSGIIRSGSFIYQGAQSSPTALAWVLHGNNNISEQIEGSGINMPGGTFANSILVHMITAPSGAWAHGSSIFQNGSDTTLDVDNVGNPAFLSPPLPKDLEIVLPPNRRTQVVGSNYVVWPTNAAYKASLDDTLCGEELLVIANDSIRQANVDYTETYGGPKGKIEIERALPANTRLRFRILPAYGSAIISSTSTTNLQIAYDGGNIINILPGRPVDIRVSNHTVGLKVSGQIEVDAIYGGNVVGGIMPKTNRSFDIGSEALRANRIWTAMQSIKTHSTHPLSASNKFTAVGTSTNNSAYIVPDSNITIEEGEAMLVIVTAIARRSEGIINPTTKGAASFRLEGCFYREQSGTAQSAGSPYNLISGAYGDGLSYALTFGTSGNDVVVVGFGEAAAVEWALTIEYQKISLPS